jgi:hypothetical protein
LSEENGPDYILDTVQRRTISKGEILMFGTELPKTFEENYAIDRTFTSIFWHDAIVKKIEYVRVALDILLDAVVLPL